MDNATKQQMIDFYKNQIIGYQWAILNLDKEEGTIKQPKLEFYRNQIKAHTIEIDKLTEKKETVEQSPMFGQALNLNEALELIKVDRSSPCNDLLAQGNCFISREAAALEVEKRKLRQLARVRMTESWREERPVWGEKWYWCLIGGHTGPIEHQYFRTLHFRTGEHAQAFLDEVGSDGIHKILEL